MVKSFILVMLSVALTCSIIAPALNVLLDFNVDSIVLNDFSEEEPSKGEQENYEEGIILFAFDKFELSNVSSRTKLSGFYTEGICMFNSKILLPPPEHIL